MKTGLSTWSLLGLDVYSAVKAIGDRGFEYVELWGEVPHAFPGWVDKGRLADALSPYGMTVTTHAPFTDLNPANPFQPVKGAVERTLVEFVEFSVALGAKVVTVHPGSVHNEALVPESSASSVATLRKMVGAAGGRTAVAIENQAGSSSRYHYPLASTRESLERLLADTPGAKCTIDTGHAHVSGQDPLELVGGVRDRLVEVHLSDNDGGGDDHLIPGNGGVPMAPLLEKISGTDVLLCLELNPHKYSPEEILSYAREAASRLKQLPR